MKPFVVQTVGASCCFAAVFLFLGAGCERTGPPTIEYFVGDTVVNAVDSAVYDCAAWDWGNRPISYDWSCSRGLLAWDSAFRVKWYSPESSGPATLRCLVQDQDGLTAYDSVLIRVRRVRRTVIDYSGAVKTGDFRSWWDTLRIGYEVEGRFVVDTSSLLVLDDSNFNRWVARQNYSALVERRGVQNDSFRFFVSATGQFHFVVDNTDEKRDRTF
ncbi:MAG: hypothetical protein ABIL25_10705, partial [candidate division WOR-3 bacterium]